MLRPQEREHRRRWGGRRNLDRRGKKKLGLRGRTKLIDLLVIRGELAASA